MKVKVIGGHGGISPGARATSYLLDEKLLIDAGSVAEGIQIEEQKQINHILISHAHLDHIKDLAFLSDNCFGLKKDPFQVYSSEPVYKSIKTHLMNDEIWPDFSVLPSKENPTITFNVVEERKDIILDDKIVRPVRVNHNGVAYGFIITHKGRSILFTQDTGPTDAIWEEAHKIKNLVAIFTEASFPNRLGELAEISMHHTPLTLKKEMQKMPKDVPIFLGHMKPNYQVEIMDEIQSWNEERITLLASENHTYHF